MLELSTGLVGVLVTLNLLVNSGAEDLMSTKGLLYL